MWDVTVHYTEGEPPRSPATRPRGSDPRTFPQVFFEYTQPANDRKEVAHELFLRDFMRFDEEDPEAVAAFMREHGPLTALHSNPLRYLPEYPVEVFETETFASARTLEWARNHGHHPDYLALHETVMFHVRALRSCVKHWHAHMSRDIDLMRMAWSSQRFTEPSDDEQAWRWFEDFMNAALAAYPAHITTGVYREDRSFWHGTAYTAMALQLANHLHENWEWKVCANERCGQLFNRQDGRADHRQHRVDAMYCTRACGRAQAERDRRKRLAAEKKKGPLR